MTGGDVTCYRWSPAPNGSTQIIDPVADIVGFTLPLPPVGPNSVEKYNSATQVFAPYTGAITAISIQGSPDTVATIAYTTQNQVNSAGTPAADTLWDENFYIWEYPAAATADSELELLTKTTIIPTPNFGPGVTQAWCGVSSIDIYKTEGDTVTYTLGYRNGGVDTDSAEVYEMCEDFLWDGTSFNAIGGSKVLSNVLASDEVEGWKQPDTETDMTLSSRVFIQEGVKRITMQGHDDAPDYLISPSYVAEVYTSGYFVYFESNISSIYGVGTTPPGKPSWGGTARAIYFQTDPGNSGVNTLLTSSLNNTVEKMRNGVFTGPISIQGIIAPIDNDLYSYGMCRFYDDIEMPSGVNIQYTSVQFIQYDAYVPGLGNVQAALDNLFANVGSVNGLEAFGGTTVSTDFDNHVLSLVTPRRYATTGVTLTSGVSATIIHNLDQKIVQVAVYDESNYEQLPVDVTLVNDSSFTITSTSTATVSLVVLR